MPEGNDAARTTGTDTVETWPHLVFVELIATLLVCSALWVFSVWVEAPLEGMADPSYTPRVAKAPWYFVGLQELLVYFDPWIAGVMLPGMIIVGLMAIPYVDRSTKGTGRYAPRERPLAWSFFLSGLFLWFALIAIGQLSRGPHWAWYWPGESWDLEKPPAAATRDLLPWAGGAAALTYVAAGLALPAWLFPSFRKQLGTGRYVVAMLLLLATLAVPLKIGLRLLFDIHYVVTTPWFNI